MGQANMATAISKFSNLAEISRLGARGRMLTPVRGFEIQD